MENPRPRSVLSSSMVITSSVHMARPVSGSRDLDFSLERSALVSVALELE